jgi:Undecaprenyl-phosphate galactose phosphotransferase WbaP
MLSVVGMEWLANLSAILLPLSGGVLAANMVCGLYPGTGMHPMVELRQTSLSITLVCGAFLGAILFASVEPMSTVALLLVSWAMLLVSVPLARAATRRICTHFRWWGQPVLIFSDGFTASSIFDAMRSNLDRGLRPIGVIGDPTKYEHDLNKYPYLGPHSQAAEIAERYHVYWAVVSMPDRSPSEVRAILDEYASAMPYVIVVPDAVGIPSLWNSAFSGVGLSGILFKQGLLLPFPQFIKRAMDLSIGIIGGIVMAPVLLAFIVLIKLSSRGRVFYHQKRVGLNGRHFQAWKFRTMVADADSVLKEYLQTNPEFRQEWESNHKLKNDPRITAIGRFLRKTSLDELPQVWNVLRGEMSLVGPRPIVDAEIKKYDASFDLYTKVLPGISGLWQVSGRNDTTYKQRVELDAYYVRNWSPWMDLYILVKTIDVVLCRKGAY